MHSDGIIVFGIILFLPDQMKQFLRADHLPLSLTQNPQNSELRGSQVQRFLIQKAFMCLVIKGEYIIFLYEMQAYFPMPLVLSNYLCYTSKRIH